MALITKRPFSTVYILGVLGFGIACAPFLLVKYATPQGRQRPEWTLRQAVSVHIIFYFIYHVARIQLQTKLPLSPGKEKERFVVIKKAADSVYKGPLAPNEDVKPADVGASWYPAALTPSSDTRSVVVVLHIHGGGYVIGDGRTRTMGYPAAKFLKYGRATHVLCPAYRLSTLPASSTSNPFPAAIQDCLAAYIYLTRDLKIPPSNIILSGDSAGGNAVATILRYIVEYGAELDIPAPSAAWLWSPWIQLSESTSDGFTRTNVNYKSDYISHPFSSWGAHAYAGLAGEKILSSPYVSHKGNPFKTEVPLWVNAGGAEVLFFDIAKFVDEMKSVGNNVTLDVDEYLPHDAITIPQLGFDKEVTAAVQRAGEWIGSVRK